MRISRNSPGVSARRRCSAAIGVTSAAAAMIMVGAPATAAEPVAALSLTAPATAEVGDVVTISVGASAAADLYALDLDLAYDAAALAPVDGGDGYLDGGFGAASIGDDAVGVAYTRLGTSPGVAGDAEIATLAFEVVGDGRTTVAVSGGSLIGTEGESAALGEIAPVAIDVAADASADADADADADGGADGTDDADGTADAADGTDDTDAVDGTTGDDASGEADVDGDASADAAGQTEAEGELAVTGGTIAGAGALAALAAGAVVVGAVLVRRRKERA